MQFARSSLSQPYWVYHPGIAFENLIRRSERPLRTAEVDFGGNGELGVAIAHSPDELRAAATLVESRYAARGYRLSADAGGLPAGVTLIATGSDAILGTLTLRLDGPRGLAADETYGNAIDAVRHAGRDVCELTRLAVSAGTESRSVLSVLFGLAYVVARRLNSVSDAFIEVNPRHVVFYRKLFGFVVAAAEQVCPRVMAPAVLLRLELERLDGKLGEIGALARLLISPVGSYAS